MRPELSIVIPSHRRTDCLRQCLDSVRRHAPAGSEVLVVDDGSLNACVSQVARSWGVASIRLPRQKGFCAAANAGIAATSGTFVELLNDDTQVCPDWATNALAPFQDPTVGAVSPLVLLGPLPSTRQTVAATEQSAPVRIDSAGDRYYVGGIAGKRNHRQPVQAVNLRPCRVFGASASAAFYRRSALERSGALAIDFRAYFEDVDLSFRLHQAGYHIVFEPRSRVLHQVSATHGRPNRRLLEQQSLNEERVFWRNLPAPLLRGALPRHGAVLAAKTWRRWQEGTLLPFLCGRLRILAEVPSLWRHRRRLGVYRSSADTTDWLLEHRFWSN